MMGCGSERGGSVTSFVIPWLCLAGFGAGFTARELGRWFESRRNWSIFTCDSFLVMHELEDAGDDG